MFKSKHKTGGPETVDFFHRTLEDSGRSSEQHKAMLETRRSILKKLLLRMGRIKR